MSDLFSAIAEHARTQLSEALPSLLDVFFPLGLELWLNLGDGAGQAAR